MKPISAKYVIHALTVGVFILVCIGSFYVIYWADLPDKAVSLNQAPEQIMGDLTFIGEAQRFLKVYFSNSFVDEADRLQFVRIEALRLAAFPVRDDAELILRDELLKNLEQIIIKEREVTFDISSEEIKLQTLLQQIP